MCIICTQYQLGKLTPAEALSAAGELVSTGKVSEDHIAEVKRKLVQDLDKIPLSPEVKVEWRGFDDEMAGSTRLEVVK